MRRPSLISIAGLVLLVACNGTRKPSSENFTKAIDQYLTMHGETCTSIGRQFPIDIPAAAQQAQYGFGPKLIALQQAGLLSETNTTAVIHGMLDPLRGTTPPQAVRRYQLTAEGQKYFRQVPGTFGQTGGLCYRQKTVDSVLKWGNPVTVNGYSQIEAIYTYKIANLAAWAERLGIQQAFPDIGATVNAASKLNQTVGLQFTNSRWQVSGS